MAFLGPESEGAGEAAECAAEQGRFWDFHDTLFENWAGENKGAFSNSNLKRFAKDIAMDSDAFDSCLDSGRYAERVKNERIAGQKLDVRSVPTFFINGSRVDGLRDYEFFQKVIGEELAKAQQ